MKSLVDKGLASATVRKAHQGLSFSLKAAVDNGYLVRNPTKGVPCRRSNTRRCASHCRGDRAAGGIDARYRALILILAYVACARRSSSPSPH